MGFLSSTKKGPDELLREASKIWGKAQGEGRELTKNELRLIKHHTDRREKLIQQKEKAHRWRWKKK